MQTLMLKHVYVFSIDSRLYMLAWELERHVNEVRCCVQYLVMLAQQPSLPARR